MARLGRIVGDERVKRAWGNVAATFAAGMAGTYAFHQIPDWLYWSAVGITQGSVILASLITSLPFYKPPEDARMSYLSFMPNLSPAQAAVAGGVANFLKVGVVAAALNLVRNAPFPLVNGLASSVVANSPRNALYLAMMGEMVNRVGDPVSGAFYAVALATGAGALTRYAFASVRDRIRKEESAYV